MWVYPHCPQFCPQLYLFPGVTSMRSKSGDVGFSHVSAKCASSLRVNSSEVANFQLFEKSRIQRMFGGFSAQLGFEP